MFPSHSAGKDRSIRLAWAGPASGLHRTALRQESHLALDVTIDQCEVGERDSSLGKRCRQVRATRYLHDTADDAKLERAKAFINARLAAGHFQAQVAGTFPLESVVEAYRYLKLKIQFEKIVPTLD